MFDTDKSTARVGGVERIGDPQLADPPPDPGTEFRNNFGGLRDVHQRRRMGGAAAEDFRGGGRESAGSSRDGVAGDIYPSGRTAERAERLRGA